jgi:rhamnosyltransferase
MIYNGVCAVVVTFHPASEVLANLSQVHQQVQNVVVVDNGSRLESLAPLRAASASAGFHLIENGENLGVATALNIGIRQAQALGAVWVLLFDQDSALPPVLLKPCWTALPPAAGAATLRFSFLAISTSAWDLRFLPPE